MKSKLTVSMGKVYFLAKFWTVPAAESSRDLQLLCTVRYSAEQCPPQEWRHKTCPGKHDGILTFADGLLTSADQLVSQQHQRS